MPAAGAKKFQHIASQPVFKKKLDHLAHAHLLSPGIYSVLRSLKPALHRLSTASLPDAPLAQWICTRRAAVHKRWWRIAIELRDAVLSSVSPCVYIHPALGLLSPFGLKGTISEGFPTRRAPASADGPHPSSPRQFCAPLGSSIGTTAGILPASLLRLEMGVDTQTQPV